MQKNFKDKKAKLDKQMD